MTPKSTVVRLPTGIVSRADVVRALRELESINELMDQAALRADVLPSLPRISQLTRELAEINTYDISLGADRARLIIFLDRIKDLAPVMHITFASEPSDEATAKLVAWLRTEISSYTLLQIGVQPAIIAGCILRTSSRVFDFSMRRRIEENKRVLREKIGLLRTAS